MTKEVSILNYIDLIKKKPLFFLAEKCKGMLNSKNRESFEYLINEFESVGYNFTYKLLVADFVYLNSGKSNFVDIIKI